MLNTGMEVLLIVRTEDDVDTTGMVFVLKNYHCTPRDVFPEVDYLAVLNVDNVAPSPRNPRLRTAQVCILYCARWFTQKFGSPQRGVAPT